MKDKKQICWLVLLSIFLFGCYDVLGGPDTSLRGDISGLVGTHEYDDIVFDYGFGLYPDSGSYRPSCSAVIGYLPYGLDVFETLYVVEDVAKEDCGWHYSGGCSSKVVFEKTVTLRLAKELFAEKNGKFSIGLFIYGYDQTEEERTLSSKCHGRLLSPFSYAVVDGLMTVSKRT